MGSDCSKKDKSLEDSSRLERFWNRVIERFRSNKIEDVNKKVQEVQKFVGTRNFLKRFKRNGRIMRWSNCSEREIAHNAIDKMTMATEESLDHMAK